jgi:hypothetical protein
MSEKRILSRGTISWSRSYFVGSNVIHNAILFDFLNDVVTYLLLRHVYIGRVCPAIVAKNI